MPPRKIKCSFKECKDAAQRIAGDCGFCNGHFCGRHRLLEDHKCTGLEDVRTFFPLDPFARHSSGFLAYVNTETNAPSQCKKAAHEQNAAQLQSERTHVIKGV